MACIAQFVWLSPRKCILKGLLRRYTIALCDVSESFLLCKNCRLSCSSGAGRPDRQTFVRNAGQLPAIARQPAGAICALFQVLYEYLLPRKKVSLPSLLHERKKKRGNFFPRRSCSTQLLFSRYNMTGNLDKVSPFNLAPETRAGHEVSSVQ